MCGLLLVNKPSGITSFAAVAKVRKLTGERHVGHTGTLDPMATGVLPVLIGRATKLCDYMLCADKCYNAEIMLGVTTDTLDITGNVTEKKAVAVNEEMLDGALKAFTGEMLQTPPMFSAIKQNGVRLYDIARKGDTVDIPPRKITVFYLKRESGIDKDNRFMLSCRVSKGTYIRSFCRDIGEYLGTGAVLTALERSETAGFRLEECVALDMLSAENISDYILPAERAVGQFTAAYLTKSQAFRFSNGGFIDLNRISANDFVDGETVRVFCENRFLGLGLADTAAGILKFRCIVNPLGQE